ncbi:LacI family DNA-binding transcriptional regulator [Rhizobium lusitanum]|uniref:LacI family DNA-binding transcriptional regulator n=1 Tax=Rhizobium lusitanum TaxID=293958 RepID=UPI00195CDE0F|nr:LacI family DNA-binding transcriptional regulator [Rhizobium lusitanum]MBM7049206.1 LacI family DNA-binding transcriptional regulator [Rhizobium lusitanum]
MSGERVPTANMAMVARVAGVSRATVSNVLNHPDRVHPDTVAAVNAAIHQLKFVRNGLARTLAAGHANNIGIIVSGFDHSYSSEIIVSAQDKAIEAGMHVVITCSNHDIALQDDHLRYLHGEGVAAVILVPMPNSDASISRAIGRGTRLILIDYDGEPLNCSSVRIDNIATGRLAATYLLESGKSRLHFVGPDGDRVVIRDRCRGVTEAVGFAGMSVSTVQGLSREAATAQGREIASLARDGLIDGVIAATDIIGMGVIFGLKEIGLKVPEDVAVVGCDYNAFAWRGDVTLTSVDLLSETVGATAMQLALDQVKGRVQAPCNIVLQPRLVIRGS